MSEDRHYQIRERAGLEESRLNEGFIEFLRKYSSTVMGCVLIVVAGYWMYNKYTQSKQMELSSAFEEYQLALAGGKPNPAVLVEIAEKYKSVKSVGILSRLAAADAYLKAVREGNALGAATNPDGTLQSADGALSPELRDQYLGKAKEQYQLVFDEAMASKEKVLLAVPAGFGLASVSESQGNKSETKVWYTKVAEVAEKAGDGTHAGIARKRLETLDALDTMVVVMNRSEVPKKPEPAAAPGSLTPTIQGTGSPATVEPPAIPSNVPGTEPNSPAAPAPAPATDPSTPGAAPK